MQKQSGQSLNSSVLCLLMSREEAESLTELRARAFGGGTPYLWLIPSLICFSSLLPPPSLLLARCRFDLFPTWLHEDKCVNVRSLTMEHYCFCPVSATVTIRSCALLEKLIKTMAGAPPEQKHLDGSSSSSKHSCLFKLDSLRFKAERGALRVVWASEPSNTRAPESNIYHAYTSACQKNSSGGKLNIKKAFQPLKEMSGREPDKLTQRGTGCVFCVYSCLSSDESSPQICRHT